MGALDARWPTNLDGSAIVGGGDRDLDGDPLGLAAPTREGSHGHHPVVGTKDRQELGRQIAHHAPAAGAPTRDQLANDRTAAFLPHVFKKRLGLDVTQLRVLG